MEVINFDRIVSVNNEVQGHGAQNILSSDGEISPNKNWMCEKGTEKAVAILQLERAAVLTSVHIGNAHSAFVEVLVGKAADSSDQFEVREIIHEESLIPMSVFMNPHESKTGINPNRIRFFNKEDFNEATATKSWDRIKVVCSQPFNKYVPYGLCFLKVHGEKEAKKTEVFQKDDDKDEIQVGSFFKKKRNSGGDKALTVDEKIKEAEKKASLVKHIPISVAKISEKLCSEKKSKPHDNEKEEQRKKVEGKAPKRKNDKSLNESITLKKRKDGNKEDKVLEKVDEKTEVEKISRQIREENPRPEKKKRQKKKPFDKLMEDVVLVISGFKNPLRGDLRSKALQMGAKYSADWEPHCTHLVCAYENTPKFHQVKGRGKIVKKDWVEMCHKDKKRYPWRKFALDKTDLKKAESEEEVDAEEESEAEEQIASSYKADSSNNKNVGESSPEKTKSGDDDYNRATDDEVEENIEDTTDYPMPHLPDIFSLKTFYVDPNLQNKATLERYIIAYNGILTDTFHKDVDFYITEKGGAPVELFRKKAPNLVAIKPSWIWEINLKQKYVSTALHLFK